MYICQQSQSSSVAPFSFLFLLSFTFSSSFSFSFFSLFVSTSAASVFFHCSEMPISQVETLGGNLPVALCGMQWLDCLYLLIDSLLDMRYVTDLGHFLDSLWPVFFGFFFSFHSCLVISFLFFSYFCFLFIESLPLRLSKFSTQFLWNSVTMNYRQNNRKQETKDYMWNDLLWKLLEDRITRKRYF